MSVSFLKLLFLLDTCDFDVRFVFLILDNFRNAVNTVFKVFAWLYTGSHSMFAECIHSFADTTNQIILAYGIHKSTQVMN